MLRWYLWLELDWGIIFYIVCSCVGFDFEGIVLFISNVLECDFKNGILIFNC